MRKKEETKNNTGSKKHMMHHKIVIANSKFANYGKSTSVKYVFELLSSRYNYHVKIPVTGYDPTADVVAIVEIPQSDGHIVKVGIESMGDPGYERPQESVDYFRNVGCEIILIATRIRRPTIGYVTDLRDNHHWQVIWFDNSTMWVDDYNNKPDLSGTRLDKQDKQLQDQLSRDYGFYVASMIERLVLNNGNL